MKYIAVFLLLFSINCFSKGEEGHHLPHRIRVGANLEEDIGLSATTELNIYQSSIYSNHFIEYRTEDNLEGGLYFNNIPIEEGGIYLPTYTYDSYFGLSKFFNITKDLRVGIGTQVGTELRPGTKTFLNFDYGLVEYEFTDRFTFGAGPYFANRALSTTSQNFGAIVNMSYKILKGKLWTEASWYSGDNNISGSMVNLFWKPVKKVELYIGTQVPAKNSGNEFAGNIGFVFHLE